MFVYVFMYIYIYIHTHTYMYVCMHACMHVCVYVCMYVCMYVYIYIYIFIICVRAPAGPSATDTAWWAEWSSQKGWPRAPGSSGATTCLTLLV